MTKKMTKVEMFKVIKSVVEGASVENKDEVLAFIGHEIELIENRSSSKKPTKTQKENVGIMELIKTALFEVAKPVTITELLASNAELAQYTPQKISALIKQMKDRGEVIRTEEKKKAYFSLAEQQEESYLLKFKAGISLTEKYP